jgi:hypothetical protein
LKEKPTEPKNGGMHRVERKEDAGGKIDQLVKLEKDEESILNFSSQFKFNIALADKDE